MRRTSKEVCGACDASLRFRWLLGFGAALLLLAVCGGCNPGGPGPRPTEAVPPLELSRNGISGHVITLDEKASAPERHAAEELAAFLKQVTGAEFVIQTPAEAGLKPQIAVGPGAAKALAPALSLDGLGAEGIVIQAVPPSLILTGGVAAPRGTLYAVYSFLEDQVGCRWWTRTESTIPDKPTLAVAGDLKVRYLPPLEKREPYYREGFDKDWAVRMKDNGFYGLDEARGGSLRFAGRNCHTFFFLVPPEEHFKKHPEWFSEIKGERKGINTWLNGTQLCLTNPELTAFVIGRVKEWLRASPGAAFVSLTQNDWHGWCTCAQCKAVDDAEGGPSGTMIRFANAVAEAIEPEFPHVAIDTFAYEYTRKPPKLTKPRHNVVVRLCSIECDFSRPLEDEVNRSFREDIENWAKICNRLYIWDYVTNFRNYIQPHPNLRVLGPNVRFFVRNHAKGILEQGNYQSSGGEFSALRLWLTAKLMWNPALDDQALLNEFLSGYYGPAAPFLRRYIDLLQDRVEATGVNMRINMPVTAPYLDLATLLSAEALLQQAEQSVVNQPDLLRRVRIAHLPVRYVLFSQWPQLKMTATRTGVEWLTMTRGEVLAGFEAICAENQITHLWEDEKRPFSTLRNSFDEARRESPAPPAECRGLSRTDWIDFQDEFFPFNRSEWGALKPDARASDGMAAWMPGTHREWALALRFADSLALLQGEEWTAYLVLRVDRKAATGLAFSSGIYDPKSKLDIARLSRQAAEITDGEYHTYKLGDFKPTPDVYLWVAPPENPDSITGIRVDRIFLIRKSGK